MSRRTKIDCPYAEEILSIEKTLATLSANVVHIRKALDGNGEKGLIKDTRENTDFRIGLKANIGLIKWLSGSSILISIFTAIIAYIL